MISIIIVLFNYDNDFGSLWIDKGRDMFENSDYLSSFKKLLLNIFFLN